MRTCWITIIALTAWALAAPLALAGVDVAIGNGDKVRGSFSPAHEVEVFRVSIPEGAVLSVSVKGKKAKGSKTAPVPTIDVLFANGVVASGVPKGSGAKVTKFVVQQTGSYVIQVSGDGVTTGDYDLKVVWKEPKSAAANLTTAAAGVTLDFATGDGALLNLSVKAAKGSPALPQFDSLLGIGADETLPLTPRPGPAASSDNEKRLPSPGLDDYRLRIISGGPDGPVAVKVKIKPAKPSKRRISLTNAQIGSDGDAAFALGMVLGGGGGFSVGPGDDAGIAGAGIDIPANALENPTVILIGTSPDVALGNSAGLRSAGPAVFFGPEGQRFDEPVTVTIPFDPTGFASDFSSIRIVQRDAKGNLETIDPDTYVFNEISRTVSFQVSHFTTFQAFKPTTPPYDLNDDGFDDLVVNAPLAGNQAGAIYVFFGGPGLASSETGSADVTIVSFELFTRFGREVRVADVNGDGVPDLLTVQLSSVFVFFGGSGFNPTRADQADVVIQHVAFAGMVLLDAKDANGDGVADILIGSPGGGNAGNGEAFLFLGGAGITSTNTLSADARFEGEGIFDEFGVAGAIGDVTGDSVPDVLISANRLDSENRRGRVYVFKGATYAAENAAADAAIILTGERANDSFGHPLAVGDVSGDGKGDVVVAELHPGEAGLTHVYVFFGGKNLRSKNADAANLRLAAESTNHKFGVRIVLADVVGDKTLDVMVGAPQSQSVAVPSGGFAYLFAGGKSLTRATSANPTARVVGETDNDQFGYLAPVGDVFGDGSSAILVFGPRNTAGGITNFVEAGRGYVMRSFGNAAASDVIITGRGDEFLGATDDENQ